MNFKKLMLSVGLSAMALLAMPGSTLTSPVSVQAAAHEHILETYITKQPTCTATGTEIRKCQTCGKITDTIKLPKVAHSVKTRTVREATTTHTGVTETYCVVCQKTIKKTSLPKLTKKCAHTYKKTDTISATCTSKGSITVTCKKCGTLISEKTLPKAKHEYVTEVTKAPTLTSVGQERTYCMNCTKTLEYNTLPKLEDATALSQDSAELTIGSTLQLTLSPTNKKVTWSSSNRAIVTVNRNGLVKALRTGEATVTALYKGQKFTCDITVKDIECSHEDTEEVILRDATCTKNGLEAVRCIECGKDLDMITIPATGHEWETVVSKKATCDKNGVSYEKCANCGTKKRGSEEVIEASGHKFTYKIVRRATTSRTALVQESCSVCKKKGASKVYPAIEFKPQLNLKAKTLPAGKEVKILIRDESGSVLSCSKKLSDMDKAYYGKVIKWSSSNPDVATVDSEGNVTAVSPGAAKISVKYYTKTLSCIITVR